ncbi:Crp/Fnr family transcriptional regulator [Bradyrhizobium sp. 1.29L]
MCERPRVREHLSNYVQALDLHSAQSGFCGVRHDREQRLACWLSLACDAIDDHVLPVTHDYLSAVLGLRRAGVTETLIRFEEQGLIQKMRGVLQIHERQRLKHKACSCYGIIADAYVSPEQLPHAERQPSSEFSFRGSKLPGDGANQGNFWLAQAK